MVRRSRRRRRVVEARRRESVLASASWWSEPAWRRRGRCVAVVDAGVVDVVLVGSAVVGVGVVTVVTGADGSRRWLAAGIRAAAAARFSSPIVMPVTESWTGVADSWIQSLI